jgi:hypothetical protein
MVLTLAIALAASGCSTLRRQTGECQQRVIDKIESDHPQSRGTTINSNSVQTRQQNGNKTLVTGRGRVRTQKGDYRNFTFSCEYYDTSGRVSGVRYDIE